MEHSTTLNNEGFSLYQYVKKRWQLIVIFILLITLITVIIWNNISSRKKEKAFNDKYNALYQAAVEFSDKKDDSFLELFTQAFSLALISEISRNNYDNVNIYVTSLVRKERRISEIVVSDAQDKIIVSTNKKHESRNLNEYFPFNYLNLKGISLIKQDDAKETILISPLYIFNEQKGILIIKYDTEKFIFLGNE